MSMLDYCTCAQAMDTCHILVMTLVKLIQVWILDLQLHTRMWPRQGKKIQIRSSGVTIMHQWGHDHAEFRSSMTWAIALLHLGIPFIAKLDSSFCMQAASQGTDTLPTLG